MNSDCELAIIGAGAAGVMACHAAFRTREDLRVVLLEKERNALRKFKITGKGRCNLTTAVSPDFFFQELGRSGKFLRSAWQKFNSTATQDFFHSIGVDTKEERGQRIFPTSESAFKTAVAFFDSLPRERLNFQNNCAVHSLTQLEDGSFRILGNQEFHAQRVLLATGGMTYSSTGSDGAFYPLLERLGHTIISPRHAICGMVAASPDLISLAGISLRNVTLSLWQNNRKLDESFGEALFTGEGMSGPTILRLSRSCRDAFLTSGQVDGDVHLQVDFKPALDETTLDARLQRDLAANPTRQAGNALAGLLPRTLLEIIFQRAELNPLTKAAELPKKIRRKLIRELKGLKIPLARLDSLEAAVITMGGVKLSEVNPRTMESRIVPGLYLAGELLDLDGPTGGYNLQIAFSTGWVAGASAALAEES